MPIAIPVTDTILQITLLTAAALVVKLTMERLHIPGLIGLILLGMVLGPEGLRILPREPVVDLLGGIGLIYIMFLAGMEVDWETAKSRSKETAALGMSSFLLTFLPAVAVGRLMEWGWPAAVLLGAVISSHTLLTYPMVQKMELQHRPAVSAVVGGTLITDTLALVLLVVVLQFGSAGTGGTLDAMRPLLLLALIAVLSVIIVPRLSRWMFKFRSTKAENALYVLVMMLLLASATDLVGTEKILGAFLAGICINPAISKREDLREHVEFAGNMIFIPFFFVATGMLIDVSVFVDDPRVWLLAGVLIALLIGGKLAAALITGRIFRYSLPDRLLMFSLTVPQAAATLAVTTAARQAGFFDALVVDAVIILIAMSCLLGAAATGLIGRRLQQRRKVPGGHRR